MYDIESLHPIVADPGKLNREAMRRRKPYQEISISNSAVEEYTNQGWTVVKELKTTVRLRRQLAHDESLENRVWYLFYLLGYPELGSGRNFKIKIERKGARSYWKQIDVFAKDDETVIVTECKSSIQVSRRSLQKDVEEFSSLKGPIANAVRNYYGKQTKLKIIWLFVTNNIVWSNSDKQHAAGIRINIVTERELRYYLQIAEHLRSAARFQFLAEFLKDQSIPEMENVRVPAIKGKLGGRTFYSFVSTPKQMLKIAFVNHRSLNDPEGAPTYQRLVSRNRLRQISQFLNAGGFFPTNILVNFSTKGRFEQIAKDDDANVAFGYLYLPNRYRSAWVIDGQHRLYGYAPLSDQHLLQNVMVVAFECLDKAEEANLFVTINHEQKSVPKTLLDDLEGELKWGSDRPAERIGAISARLIGLLNSNIGDVLYGRVTQQGISATDRTCLTVPALKEGLRRSQLIGSAILNKKEYSPGPLCGINDLETLDRARSVLNSYFERLSTANPEQWELGRSGYLCTNVALQAYCHLLGSVICYMESNKGLNAREMEPLELIAEIEEYLTPITCWLSDVSRVDMEKAFKVKYGTGGPREYYFRLCRMIHESFSSFCPNGLSEWEQAQSEERVAEADRQLKELNILVQKFIFDRLKERYGLEKDAYWHNGVIDKSIRSSAYDKSLDYEVEDRLPLENYLEFIEYKKIVENKVHWPMFKPVFDIPEPSEKNHTKNVRWMEGINELRRISAHPTESRRYKLEDFDYISYVFEKFKKRVDAFGIEETN